ncbi:MAG: helix-turn-helix transcriptional regulator [Ruminococcaceae bacterium]|nr:helix-turn-helix transcriptional regulator [Oscillospiraceae bacterium]
MTVYRDIGRFIRDKREYKHLTVAELAESSDTSITGLENIELGDVDPKWSTLKRIFKALYINVGDLSICVYGKDLSLV